MKKYFYALLYAMLYLAYPTSFAQNIIVNGNALNLGGNCYQLTAAQPTQAGSIWSQNKITLNDNLEIHANLNFGNNNSGADGIAFVLQGLCNGIGSSGGGIGYEGITPSVAIEFDTWTNSQYNDPVQDHIAIQQNGNLTHNSPAMLSATISTLPNIEDGLDHQVVINWDAAQQVLSVTFDGVLQSSYSGDMVADIFNNNAEVFWGFTGATGAAFNNQKVCLLSVEATETQIPYEVTPVSCSGNADGAIDFTAPVGSSFMWSTGAESEDLASLPAGIYTLTVSDEGGCASTYLIQVPVAVDTTPPTALCRNSFLSLGANGSAILALPSVNNNSFDNCALASLSINSLLFECGDMGPNTVILTVTDFSGNSATCESTVTVRDLTQPLITCPATTTLCGSEANPSITGTATATDNCTVANISYSDNQSNINCDFEGTLVRTWKATDQSDNTSTCTQNIQIIRDTMPPVCLNCPGDYIASCNDNLLPLPILELSDNCDLAPTVTIDSTGSTISEDVCSLYSYSIVRLITVADRCGNYQTYTQTITVVDETAPAITCPADTTIACLDINDLSITGAAVTTDACDPSPALVYADVQSNDCNPGCIIERTWKATDACGNANTCVQTITTSGFNGFGQAFTTDNNGDGVPDPLVLGYSFHTFTITADDVDCINGWIPSSGAIPAALPRARTLVGADCRPGAIRLDADGHFENPLLAEGLTLALKLRLDSDFGQTPLSEFGCVIHPVLLQFMPANPRVSDLMRLVNLGLGNIIGPPHLPHLLAAIRCINSSYSFCGDSEDGNALSVAPGAQSTPKSITKIISKTSTNTWRAYPNPAKDKLFIELTGAENNRAIQASLLDMSGQVVQTQLFDDGVIIPVRVSELPNGMYILNIRFANGEVDYQKILIQE